MICWQLVGTLVEYLIVEDVGLDAHLTTNQVVHQHLLSAFNLEAHHILLTVGNQLLHFLLRQSQRVTHLAARVTVVLEILDLSALSLQFLWRVEGDIGLVGIQQLLHIFLIDVATLTLTVGTLVATKRDTLVELDAQPFERLDDILLCPWYKTVGVCVLDTEHQVTAMLACEQIIIKGSPHTTDVQRPRRTGCKAHPHSSF